MSTGALAPQSVTFTVTNAGVELSPVLSVATNCTWYDPATSGVNEGVAVAPELSCAWLPAGALESDQA
jgi:hypothetical protein